MPNLMLLIFLVFFLIRWWGYFIVSPGQGPGEAAQRHGGQEPHWGVGHAIDGAGVGKAFF